MSRCGRSKGSLITLDSLVDGFIRVVGGSDHAGLIGQLATTRKQKLSVLLRIFRLTSLCEGLFDVVACRDAGLHSAVMVFSYAGLFVPNLIIIGDRRGILIRRERAEVVHRRS